ncbi:hypothetical protein Q31a_26740 [Aureliella helgolandensis]|uniref:Uncharacterized protein n=1 Tax=Aureliella helgolandensis TaxID=2527968 RepID=A0A518G6Z3_9BACT|nr:hypothetical protein Q31a_26740 [Aureliella helgolandensis]
MLGLVFVEGVLWIAPALATGFTELLFTPDVHVRNNRKPLRCGLATGQLHPPMEGLRYYSSTIVQRQSLTTVFSIKPETGIRKQGRTKFGNATESGPQREFRT